MAKGKRVRSVVMLCQVLGVKAGTERGEVLPVLRGVADAMHAYAHLMLPITKRSCKMEAVFVSRRERLEALLGKYNTTAGVKMDGGGFAAGSPLDQWAEAAEHGDPWAVVMPVEVRLR